MRIARFGAAAGLLGLCCAGLDAEAAAPSAGELVYQQYCAVCHSAQDIPNVPSMEAMRQFAPEAIVRSLVDGKMAVQGSHLNEAERRDVAEFLSGRRLGTTPVAAKANVCRDPRPMGDPSQGPRWNGWGNDIHNTRWQPRELGGLTAADLPRLELKWAFGYPNVSSARMQPSYVGGRLFVATDAGDVYALDPKTGCEYWHYQAQAGVRTAISVGVYENASGRGTAAYFGDGRANVYAVDAETGQLLWMRKVDEHTAAAITGSPTLHDGRLFVPVQGVREESTAGTSTYPCCTFRGSLVALDAHTGEVLWKTYTVDEPKPRAKSKEGVQMWGPAGVGIWSAPTVDPKRGRVYAATGNAYAAPSQPLANAVIAFSMATGEIEWFRQITPDDNWAFGCIQPTADPAACPEEVGPDHDFAAPPALVTVNGRELLVLPQKSGMAWALDPERAGAIVWERRIGQGSGMGGQWGGASDGKNVYIGIADLQTETPGGMRALDLATGELVWSKPPQPLLCEPGPGCLAGQGSAVTAIPGAVLSAGVDGGLRAYSTEDGKVFWTFDTGREFDTVNGVPAKGGGMDGAGPVVAGGMLFLSSGYGGFVSRPGNVLLAFGLPERSEVSSTRGAR